MNEQQLIDRLLKGEAQGYSDLVSRYGRQVQLVVAQMVEDEDDVAELVQDVFMKVIDHVGEYRADRATLGTWLSRIAYNVAANHLRGWRPKIISLAGEALDYLESLDNIGSVDDDLEITEERIALLDEAIGQLRPEERLLVHLRYYEERSLSEISYVMDVKEGALASRLQRIRHKLKQLITAREREVRGMEIMEERLGIRE